MKKNKYYVLIIVIIVIIISIIIFPNNNLNNNSNDNLPVTLAILDGNGYDLTSIPAKGNYAVSVNCTNAFGEWDYYNWKLVLKDVSGNAKCSLVFKSINKMYFNDFLLGEYTEKPDSSIDLVYTELLPNYSNTSPVKTFSINPKFYYYNSSTASSDYSSYGTSSDCWSFDSTTGTFTSIPSAMTVSYNYYYATLTIPENGYYKVCYNMDVSSSSNNRLHIYNVSAYYSTSDVISGCYILGYKTAGNIVNVYEYAYSGTSSPVTTFSLEKVNESINFESGYRYTTADAKNYVKFNNELWRVIGVFETDYDSNNDNVVDETDQLVKLIREEPIARLMYGTAIGWTTSYLRDILNKTYYNYDTYKNTAINCYTYLGLSSLQCNFSDVGLNSKSRDMIVKASWFLNSGDYNLERSTETKFGDNTYTALDYVGLPYGSDQTLAYVECNPNKDYSDCIHSACPICSWFANLDGWEINPSSVKFSNSLITGYSGSNLNLTKEVRPSVYLSPDVYVANGDGTINDPYILLI